jgi:hypothetical protein
MPQGPYGDVRLGGLALDAGGAGRPAEALAGHAPVLVSDVQHAASTRSTALKSGEIERERERVRKMREAGEGSASDGSTSSTSSRRTPRAA